MRLYVNCLSTELTILAIPFVAALSTATGFAFAFVVYAYTYLIRIFVSQASDIHHLFHVTPLDRLPARVSVPWLGRCIIIRRSLLCENAPYQKAIR